jgi:hypothetical protein
MTASGALNGTWLLRPFFFARKTSKFSQFHFITLLDLDAFVKSFPTKDMPF